jgi:hypothetical protein
MWSNNGEDMTTKAMLSARVIGLIDFVFPGRCYLVVLIK